MSCMRPIATMRRIICALTLIAVANRIWCQECSRPDNQPGTCLSVYDCPAVIAQLNGGISSATATNLRRLQCEGASGRFPFICCANEVNVTTALPPVTSRPRPTQVTSSSDGSLLPGRGSCGVESLVPRIYNGRMTALDEFPWMALLEYKAPIGQRKLACGGVLISQRYVLTAAHCVTGEVITKIGELDNVRLGEYDITKTQDCIEEDCADPVIKMGIEEVVVHENYDEKARNKINDIGLIRLQTNVIFSDFVKPICLPSALSSSSRSLQSTNVHTAGWGRTLTERQSAVKLKISLPVVDQEKCQQKYSSVKIQISDTQLCAGGVYVEDTCDGDSGGPLMRMVDNYWVVEGIVSFGRGCGLEGWPALYTRVTSFETWIQQALRP